MRYRPARNSCCGSTSRIAARASAINGSGPGPPSDVGKSDAISAPAPRPPPMTGEQLGDDSTLIGPCIDREVAFGGPPPSVTHTPPSPAAIPVASAPTGIVATGALRSGSILVTVPSPALRTHTPPSPIESRVGLDPTLIVAVTAFSAGSIRETESESASETQTAPSPIAIAYGLATLACAAAIGD